MKLHLTNVSIMPLSNASLLSLSAPNPREYASNTLPQIHIHDLHKTELNSS